MDKYIFVYLQMIVIFFAQIFLQMIAFLFSISVFLTKCCVIHSIDCRRIRHRLTYIIFDQLNSGSKQIGITIVLQFIKFYYQLRLLCRRI